MRQMRRKMLTIYDFFKGIPDFFKGSGVFSREFQFIFIREQGPFEDQTVQQIFLYYFRVNIFVQLVKRKFCLQVHIFVRHIAKLIRKKTTYS